VQDVSVYVVRELLDVDLLLGAALLRTAGARAGS
jgi:hypothetical protein